MECIFFQLLSTAQPTESRRNFSPQIQDTEHSGTPKLQSFVTVRKEIQKKVYLKTPSDSGTIQAQL